MADMFAPKIQTGGGFTQPTRQSSDLEQVAVAAEGLTNLGTGLLDSYAKSQREGDGSSDPQWKVQKAAREELAAKLRTSVALKSQGRTREADSLASTAITAYHSSWGPDEALKSMTELYTGKPLEMNISSPQEQLMVDLYSDPKFMDVAYPAAYGSLAAQGVENPSQDQLEEEALNYMMEIRLSEATLEQGVRRWATGGESSAIQLLNTKMNSFIGQFKGLQNQGVAITSELLVKAEAQFFADVANISAKIPSGVDRKNFDSYVESQKAFFEGIKKAPKDFLNNMRDTTLAALASNAGDAQNVLLWTTITDNPEYFVTLNQDNFAETIKNIRNIPLTESTFNVFNVANSPIAEEGGDLTTFNREELFPPQASGTPYEELTGPQIVQNFRGTAELFSNLTITTPESVESAASWGRAIGDIMSVPNKPRMKVETVRNSLTPKFFNTLEKLKKQNPAEYNALVKQIGYGIKEHKDFWALQAGGIAEQSVFMVNKDTGQVTTSLERVKKVMGSNWGPVVKAVETSYGGDWDAMFKDGGRKLKDIASGNVFPWLRRSISEYKQINEYMDGVKWANNTIQTTLKVGASSVANKGESSNNPVVVNSAAELDALPSGTLVQLPNGDIARKN